MDEQKTPRRPDRPARDTTVMRERPRTPGDRPTGARPRTGTASEQARARTERLRAAEEGAQRSEPPIRRVEPDEAPLPRERTQRKKKKKKKKAHRVYNTNFGIKFLIMLAVVGAIAFSMTLFFKVKHIEVVFLGVDGYDLSTPQSTEAGAVREQPAKSYYTAEEIIQASEINIDENLISLSKAAAASRIHAALPYINEIQIKKSLPGTVVISVSEFKVTYGIQDEKGGWWLLSREGRILEAADEQSVSGHLILMGMPIQVPEVGDYITPVASEGVDLSEIAAKRSAAIAILEELENHTWAKAIVSVDLSSSYDIVLWYGSQFAVRIGNTETLSYKLQYLEGVLSELGKDKSGTIDLTFTEDNAAHFLPFG